MFEIANNDYIPNSIAMFKPAFGYYRNSLAMIKYGYEEFERGRNMYLWNLVTKINYRYLGSRFYGDHDKSIAIENHDRVFTEQKHHTLELIAKLVTGCLYYSIQDLVSKGKNVIFAISAESECCKEVIELIFINNSMIKKLLNCARVIPRCKMICWYENRHNILIMSKPNLYDDCNLRNVALLKLSDMSTTVLKHKNKH